MPTPDTENPLPPSSNPPPETPSQDRNVPASTAPPQVVVVPAVIVPVVVPVPVAVPIPVRGESKIPAPEGDGGAPEEEGIGFAVSSAHAAPPGAVSKFWTRVGGTGFSVSVLFHVALIVFALFYVFSDYGNEEPEKTVFISGSGGGSASRGERHRAFRKTQEFEMPKIFSKTRNPKSALPEIPKAPAMKKLDFSGKLGGGGLSEFGNDASGTLGFGGGIGGGSGPGIGDGSHFLGKFKTLLGAKIKARKIAVYLDCSGSMRPFLPAVKAEIYENFPDADVFVFSGAQTEIRDGEILGGRNMRAKTLAAVRRKPADDETDVSKLSGRARVIYGRFSAHFAAGTLGSWLDVMSRERYDALVVFSDFRDGIRQRRAGKTVYADSSYSPVADERTARERTWEREWFASFSGKSAPKLYLFSARTSPQDFLKKCVDSSGGEITILDLRKKRAPKPEEGDSPAA